MTFSHTGDPQPPAIRPFQFRLRTLLFMVVPYLAIYALVMSAIIRSYAYKPSPVPSDWSDYLGFRPLRESLAEGLGVAFHESFVTATAIAFNLVYVGIPLVWWAIWSLVKARRRQRLSHGVEAGH